MGAGCSDSWWAFSKFADAMSGRTNTSGLADFVELADEIHIGSFVPPMILLARAAPGDGEQMDQVLSAISGAISPIRESVANFEAMSPDEREERLNSLPFSQAIKARRLLEEFSEPGA
jgi:hypothetical protein